MGKLLRNMIAVFLSLLIIAGNGGISILAHTCSQIHTTQYFLADEDVSCSHTATEISCCAEEAGLMESYKCCDTKTLVLKFDEHTFSYNTDRQISFNSNLIYKQFEWPVLLSEETTQPYFEDDLYRKEITPLLNQKKMLQSYISGNLSPEPLLG